MALSAMDDVAVVSRMPVARMLTESMSNRPVSSIGMPQRSRAVMDRIGA